MLEENIKQELEKKFGSLKDKITIQRPRRIFVEALQADFFEILDYLVKEMGFSALSAITGMDEGATFGVIYHLNRQGSIILNLRIHLTRENLKIKTVTGYFLEADAYERELEDLLGIKVEGLAPGHRYPLPDNWPQGEHPLRKDWKESPHA
ncbi:MAG: NADH-quinone oxidoreductase subunit C [Candidatus Omnitrophota bacterium]|jgi:Ni,Fe-hydrogenase III component G